MLFKQAMVQAIMEGRKTQTRRGLNQATNNLILSDDELKDVLVRLSKYKLGEVVGVAETFYAWGAWLAVPKDDLNLHEFTFVDRTKSSGNEYRYFDTKPEKISKRATPDFHVSMYTPEGWFTRSSMFMPDVACRTTLKITGVRMERLLDISEADAIAEGILPPLDDCYFDYMTGGYVHPNAVLSYLSLWDMINGKDVHRANPWVFVYDFDKL